MRLEVALSATVRAERGAWIEPESGGVTAVYAVFGRGMLQVFRLTFHVKRRHEGIALFPAIGVDGIGFNKFAYRFCFLSAAGLPAMPEFMGGQADQMLFPVLVPEDRHIFETGVSGALGFGV